MVTMFATIYRLDTPLVYLKEENLEQARRALSLVYHSRGVERRLEELIFELDRQSRLVRGSVQKLTKYSTETLKGNVKKAVLIGIMLMIFQ